MVEHGRCAVAVGLRKHASPRVAHDGLRGVAGVGDRLDAVVRVVAEALAHGRAAVVRGDQLGVAVAVERVLEIEAGPLDAEEPARGVVVEDRRLLLRVGHRDLAARRVVAVVDHGVLAVAVHGDGLVAILVVDRVGRVGEHAAVRVLRPHPEQATGVVPGVHQRTAARVFEAQQPVVSVEHVTPDGGIAVGSHRARLGIAVEVVGEALDVLAGGADARLAPPARARCSRTRAPRRSAGTRRVRDAAVRPAYRW